MMPRDSSGHAELMSQGAVPHQAEIFVSFLRAAVVARIFRVALLPTTSRI